MDHLGSNDVCTNISIASSNNREDMGSKDLTDKFEANDRDVQISAVKEEGVMEDEGVTVQRQGGSADTGVMLEAMSSGSCKRSAVSAPGTPPSGKRHSNLTI
ncbi:hypothetical protein D6C89_09204 [Aureobasidium pullulans]|nr:hypothetical protein D6C89_09204 [Aureobasidium pullulans]